MEPSITDIAASLAATLNPAPPVAAPAVVQPASPPIAPAVVTPAPVMAPTPLPFVPLPPSRHEDLLQKEQLLAQLQIEARQREAAANEEKVRLLAEKGEAIAAVNLLKDESKRLLGEEAAARAALESRAKRYARDGELARALASHNLVGPHAAAQLTSLLGSQLEAYPEGDGFVVRTPTYKTANEFVAEQLARAEFSHFVSARNPQGGTGTSQGAATTIPTPPANTPPPATTAQPRNAGEAWIMEKKSANLTPAGANSGVNPGAMATSVVDEFGTVIPQRILAYGLHARPGGIPVPA